MANLLTEPEALEAWKSHPLTQAFLQYLGDRRQAMMDQWGRGQGLPSILPDLQVEAVTLGTLLHLSSDDLRTFYNIEESEDGHDTQAQQ